MDIQKFNSTLKELTDGLFYSSESDYPLELMEWGVKSDAETAATIKGLHASPENFEKVDPADFFRKYIRNQERSGDEIMIAAAGRYKKLQSFLMENSSELYVIRCGKIQVGIYIVILTKDGKRVILKTTSVET